MNRNNNKFSYTPTSDDNLLKNLEMFDRLSLRFSSRILFIKVYLDPEEAPERALYESETYVGFPRCHVVFQDVIGTNEICCWTFYGHGKKFAEICCTSIVYATDKKHTKVKFRRSSITRMPAIESYFIPPHSANRFSAVGGIP